MTIENFDITHDNDFIDAFSGAFAAKLRSNVPEIIDNTNIEEFVNDLINGDILAQRMYKSLPSTASGRAIMMSLPFLLIRFTADLMGESTGKSDHVGKEIRSVSDSDIISNAAYITEVIKLIINSDYILEKYKLIMNLMNSNSNSNPN